MRLCLVFVTLIGLCPVFSLSAVAAELDAILGQENKQLGVAAQPVPLTDDLSFLRRASVDFIARIPTNDEIQEYVG
ncbi:MAG: hypothetical protein ABGX07_19400, partial [Pirellulaceae bacterium]